MKQAEHTNIIIGPWARPPRGRAASIVSDDEALFLRCILQSQNDYGIRPPAELALPRSIGLVVDYDYVKQLMYATLGRHDIETESEFRQRLMRTAKQARLRLMQMGVVGCEDPFIWFTGKPVRGFSKTMRRPPMRSA
jgi:hypothetical protein